MSVDDVPEQGQDPDFDDALAVLGDGFTSDHLLRIAATWLNDDLANPTAPRGARFDPDLDPRLVEKLCRFYILFADDLEVTLTRVVLREECLMAEYETGIESLSDVNDEIQTLTARYVSMFEDNPTFPDLVGRTVLGVHRIEWRAPAEKATVAVQSQEAKDILSTVRSSVTVTPREDAAGTEA